MCEMLCKNAKDFSLTYGNMQHLDDEYSTCDWVATYIFSKTGKKVMNKIITRRDSVHARRSVNDISAVKKITKSPAEIKTAYISANRADRV